MACTARLRTTAAAVALTAVLAACSGVAEPEAGASPEAAASSTPAAQPSASPSPSASAEGGKPERPAAMDQHDADGAAAAAEYFLSIYDYTKTSGDTAEWEAMSHEACTFCQSVLERTREIHANGLVLDGGELSSTLVQTYARDAATGVFPLDIEVTQEASTTTRPDGSTESTTERQSGVMRVEMGLREDEWVVVTVAPKPQE